MSRENVELATRGYAALNATYASGEISDLAPIAEEIVHPEGVLTTTGKLFPEAGEWRGPEGLLRFAGQQMEAFERMWCEPLEYIEKGDRLIVPVRLGGRARHTGIKIDFSIAHLWTLREGKVFRLDMHLSKADALEAAGLRE